MSDQLAGRARSRAQRARVPRPATPRMCSALLTERGTVPSASERSSSMSREERMIEVFGDVKEACPNSLILIRIQMEYPMSGTDE